MDNWDEIRTAFQVARLGTVWIRDYAYTYDWMLRARGNGEYGGWPWPKKMLGQAEANGLMTLPCLMHSVKFDRNKPESPRAPDAEWVHPGPCSRHGLGQRPVRPASEVRAIVPALRLPLKVSMSRAGNQNIGVTN